MGGLTDAEAAIAAAHSSDWGRIVAGLIRLTGDWTVAEDATQDAFAAALARWPTDGVPDRPAAWLTTVARNRAIDILRSARTQQSKLELIGIEQASAETFDLTDDRLRLIFTCCHPALPLPARVALTLRTVAGLTVADIAAAFLVPEATMAQRLVRARRKIAHAGIPYRVPPAELMGERLNGVLAVLYLAFNTGYSNLAASELADTAIGLSEAVVDLMPRESEARGLMALMLFQTLEAARSGHANRRAADDRGAGSVAVEPTRHRAWIVDARRLRRTRALRDSGVARPMSR